MKKKHTIKLVLWLLLAAISVYTVFFGIIINYNIVADGAYAARLGIDLKGGMHAILAPEGGATVENKDLDVAITTIGVRLDGRGIYDRSVLADYENSRIIVEIPWATGETDFNPQKIVEEIGEIAQLTFAAVKKDSTGEYVQDGEPLVYGSTIEKAYVAQDTSTNSNYLIALEFTAEGKQAIMDATVKVAQNTDEEMRVLGIFLDGILVSAPTVPAGGLTSADNVSISGKFTYEDALSMSNKISSGKMPVKMVVSDGELRTITPILGENALNVMMQAGFVALIIILLFLLLYYRVPGLVSCIGLITQISLLVLLMVWLGISLTLPGIAGIILTMGMGIDANIIIFERMKEEIAKGKNVAFTIKDGFKNAFSAIADGNVTVIISALVLYYFGTGAVKGFAVTFLIGIILSFLTAVWMSRSLLTTIEKLNIFKSKWWFGGKREKGGEDNENA